MRYESSPLYVWLTVGLMAIGSAAYLAGYFMIEDFIGFFK